MWILLLIFGFMIFIGAIICLVNAEDSYDYEGLLISLGIFGFAGGLTLIIVSIVGLCGGFNKKQTSKTEVKTEVISDSTQIKVSSDTIKSILYIISYKDEDGVWAGKNVKLFGYTNKVVGDTIIVNLK